MKLMKVFMPIVGLTTLTGIVFPVVSCSKPLPKPTGITLDFEKVELDQDHPWREIVAHVEPEGFSQEVEWSSSDKTVVTVDDGVLFGVYPAPSTDPRTATITAKPKGFNNVSVTCEVTVIGEITRLNFNDRDACPWSTVVDAAEKLENGEWTKDQFFSQFTVDSNLATKENEAKNVESFDDFIGQTRQLKANRFDHEVKVVGCQQDFMDENSTKPVSFTFQFNQLYSIFNNGGEREGNCRLTKWAEDQIGVTNYWESLLLERVNETDTEKEVVWDEFPTIGYKGSVNMCVTIDRFGGGELSNDDIKDVYRGVITRKDSGWSVVPNMTEFFQPTISNIFSGKGLEESTITDLKYNTELYLTEGQQNNIEEKQYSFYENVIGDSAPGSGPISSLILKDRNDNASAYWLSSPNKENITGAFAIGSDGTIQTLNCSDNPIAVAPCFCI